MNKKPHKNLINGVASDFLNIDDRSIHYGDGLFETILCLDNKLLYWPQHFQRLQTSAEKLKLACPSEQMLLHDIKRLLDENSGNVDSACAVKIILSRGAGERGYMVPKKVSVNRLLFLSDLNEEYSSLLSTKLLSGKLFLCQQQVSINENLAGLKHLNRLENVLARNEWQGDYIDGLMCNANQHVIEGSMSNLFAVKNNQLFTPELTLSGVKGVMREVVMSVAKSKGIDVMVKNLSLKALFEMDELFISNSLIGMKAVTSLAEHRYNKSPVAAIIFEALLNSTEDHVQAI